MDAYPPAFQGNALNLLFLDDARPITRGVEYLRNLDSPVMFEDCREYLLSQDYTLWPFPVHRYPSYRGTVPRKWDVMPRYRFSLCYENIRDEPSYVTEKIFDSMRCGCVPIYWGASNITDYVDGEAFVDRRQFGSDQELEDYIWGVTEVEYGRYQEAIRAYLQCEQFVAFLPPAFVDTVISVLDL